MRRFNYKSLDEIARSAEAVAPHVRFEPDAAKVRSVLARPVQIGNTQHRQFSRDPTRWKVVTAISTGGPANSPGGVYKRFAAGGAKLVWFRSTAIQEDGRANARQLWLNSNTQDDYARLIEAIRRDHAAAFGTADDLLVSHAAHALRALQLSEAHHRLSQSAYRQQDGYARVAGSPSPTAIWNAWKTFTWKPPAGL